MADPLNLYLDKAGYTAVAHADKTSEVSRISSLNKVVYDGINIPTTQNPGEGDAVYLSNGHVLFIDGKTLNRAKLPNTYTPVGIVVYRTGTRILIAHHIPHFGKVASSWLWKIVPPSATGTSITFMARTSGYGNNVTVGTFTTDKNYITNMQGWCDDLNTWLTNHQPTSVGGADYDWYARVCTYRPYGGTPIQEVYVIADGMYNATQYTSPIVSSGATATKVIMSSIPAFTGVRLDNGGYGWRPLINLARNMSYYLTTSHNATDSITNGNGIIGKADFESNKYPTVSAYYGTWEKYLESLYYTWPCRAGNNMLDWEKCIEWHNALATETYVNKNNVEVPVFPGIAFVESLKTSLPGFDWHAPGLTEMFLIWGRTDDSDNGPLADSFINIGGYKLDYTQSYLAPAKFDDNYAWTLSSGGSIYGTYAFQRTLRTIGVAWYDLTN